MFDKQAAIYAARSRQDAFLLRNLLAEEGIPAVVVNDVLEGGSGVDIVGWPTLARVVVNESDAERARHIALVFDRKTAAAGRKRTDEAAGDSTGPSAGTVLDGWPTCPECDSPRSTRCPICGTAGYEFPAADSGFLDLLGPGAAAAASAGSCSCGPGGCGSGLVPEDAGRPAAEGAAVADAPVDDGSPDALLDPTAADPARPMLMCPTCDEPFVPEYLRRCEWCGHEFPDGTEIPPPAADPDPINSRVIAVIFALLVLGAAMTGYFFFVF